MNQLSKKAPTFWLSLVLLSLLIALLISTHIAQTKYGFIEFELRKNGDGGDSNEMAYLQEDRLFSSIKSSFGVFVLSLLLSWSTAKSGLVKPAWKEYRKLGFIGLISAFSLIFLSILRTANPIPVWQYS